VSAFALLLVATWQLGLACLHGWRDLLLAGLALPLMLGHWLPAYGVMLLFATAGLLLP
jgi:hypothetical protein